MLLYHGQLWFALILRMDLTDALLICSCLIVICIVERLFQCGQSFRAAKQAKRLSGATNRSGSADPLQELA
jgi:hypothetical protein